MGFLYNEGVCGGDPATPKRLPREVAAALQEDYYCKARARERALACRHACSLGREELLALAKAVFRMLVRGTMAERVGAEELQVMVQLCGRREREGAERLLREAGLEPTRFNAVVSLTDLDAALREAALKKLQEV